MRVLLIGPIIANHPHSAEGGVRNAFLDLGHKIDCWDPRVRKVLLYGEVGEAPEANFFPSSYDLILCMGPGVNERITSNRIWNEAIGPKALWNSEPITLKSYHDKFLDQRHLWDIHFTFDPGEVELYQKNTSTPVHALLQGYDPTKYKPLGLERKGICFVGSIGGKWENRIPVLQKLDLLCRKHTIPLRVYSGLMDSNKVNEIYNQHQVVFNVGLKHSGMTDFQSLALQQRVFEAWGSGTPCLTSDPQHAHDTEIFTYTSELDFENSLLNCMALCDSIGVKIRDNLSRHSYQSRIKQLIGILENI